MRYTPSGTTGADSFTYTASDGRGGTATATVAMTVTAVNRNPVAVADSRTVAEDGTLSFLASQLKANDTDPDGDVLTVTAVAATASTHGTVTLVAGTVTYKPDANYNGAASFAYTVSDGRGGTATGTVNVTISAVADVPTLELSAATVSAQYGDPIASVTATATDPDTALSALVFSTVGLPAGLTLVDHDNGTATISGKPTVVAGAYAATIRVSDGRLATKPLAVTVTRETATVAWNDGYFASASLSTSASAGVTLKALFTQAADGSAGDPTKSKVEFRLYRTARPGSTPDLVAQAAVTSAGTAQILKNLSIGTWVVIVRHVANGYFEASDSQPIVFTVGLPGISRTAFAAGFVTDPSTANAPVAVSSSFPRGHFGIAGWNVFGTTYATSVYTLPRRRRPRLHRREHGRDDDLPEQHEGVLRGRMPCDRRRPEDRRRRRLEGGERARLPLRRHRRGDRHVRGRDHPARRDALPPRRHAVGAGADGGGVDGSDPLVALRARPAK